MYDTPNLDAMNQDELLSYYEKHRHTRDPVQKDLARYALNKFIAAGHRLDGHIHLACQHDTYADNIYAGLPLEARW